jgi:transcription antitermination factor NusG
MPCSGAASNRHKHEVCFTIVPLPIGISSMPPSRFGFQCQQRFHSNRLNHNGFPNLFKSQRHVGRARASLEETGSFTHRTSDCGSTAHMPSPNTKIEFDWSVPTGPLSLDRPVREPGDVGTGACLSSERLDWFAIAVKPRHEKRVAYVLDTKGYETFVPLYKHRHRRAWGVRDFDLPLFPGYVFSRFDLLKRLPVVVTPGVNRILGVGATPTPVDPREITSLRTALDKALSAKTLPFFHTGNKVRICEGPLQGVDGVVVLARGTLRIVLSVTLLQRSVLVEVDSNWLVPESAQSGATA